MMNARSARSTRVSPRHSPFVLACFVMLFMAPCLKAVARSGKASYYTHSSAMITAANEPRGSMLRATNPQTGKSITVKVVGSGPFVRGRVLDLSSGAFKALYGSTSRGVGPVSYSVISRGGRSRILLASRGGTRYRANHRSWKHRYHRSH